MGVYCSIDCKATGQRIPWDQLGRGGLKKRWTQEGRPLICERCGHDKPWNIQIHHRHYRRLGGSNDPSNLEPLCLNCHGTEHYEAGLPHDHHRQPLPLNVPKLNSAGK